MVFIFLIDVASFLRFPAAMNLRVATGTTYRPKPAPRPYRAVPVATCRVAAGFPKPSDDHVAREIDFNEWLVANPPATYLRRAEGDSMIGRGINDGDWLVIDCSAKPVNGSIVIAILDSEETVKTLRYRGGKAYLEPANAAYPRIEIDPERGWRITGVVKFRITQF